MDNKKKTKFSYLDNKNPYAFSDTEIETEKLHAVHLFHPPMIELGSKDELIELSRTMREESISELKVENILEHKKMELFEIQNRLRASVLSGLGKLDIEYEEESIDEISDFYFFENLKKCN